MAKFDYDLFVIGAGSGSVITRDVSADALALARGQQVEKPGWAAAFRERKLREKAAKNDR